MAAKLKVWDVDGMMAAMPARTFEEWQAYLLVEAEELEDMRKKGAR